MIILKGILFYTTMITICLILCSTGSLSESGYLFPALTLAFVELILCSIFISNKDMSKLTRTIWDETTKHNQL